MLQLQTKFKSIQIEHEYVSFTLIFLSVTRVCHDDSLFIATKIVLIICHHPP